MVSVRSVRSVVTKPDPGHGDASTGPRYKREDGKATMLIWCVDSVMVTE